ncbi:aminotransferase class I/II-fold pyridoxal phosphate-dependent enzyme [Sciscionella marina]|uniref:pyridoxal phosphate-dependent aminotransferase n=1 Tax=Sciscionella marina TaxID=508770 RepID=UPI0003665C65
MLRVAERAAVAPFHVMEVLSAAGERQRERGDVVSLAAGQPSIPAPAVVRETAARAVTEYRLGYTEQLGIPELRAGIAGHYRHAYGLTVEAEDVVVTTGSSGAFTMAFLAAFDAGDRVALPNPGYPCYRNILGALGCEVVDLPCGAEQDYVPTPELLDRQQDLAGLVVAGPANPTGTVLGAERLAELAEYCRDRGIQLISDEIYHGITYGADSDCAWRTSREAIVVNSFSKYWAMTGWRIGWMLVPARLRRAVDTLVGNFSICAPVHSQLAAVAAFEPSAYAEADEAVRGYAGNRKILLDGLGELGLDRFAPAEGAFYVYVDISSLTTDSVDWCRRLLAETGVAVVPGVDFDPERGNEFVRLSFAGTSTEITEGLGRIGEWLSVHSPGQRSGFSG